MSTRSIIVITGKQRIHSKHDQTVRLYKHSDGYPTGNLPIIVETLKKAQKQIKAYNKGSIRSEKASLHVDQVVGLLIGEATSVYGQGANVDAYGEDTGIGGAFEPSLLGKHGDVEWHYIVDLENKTVGIYGGGDSQEAFKIGPADPFSYALNLYPEYQEDCRQETARLLAQITKLGFKLAIKKD